MRRAVLVTVVALAGCQSCVNLVDARLQLQKQEQVDMMVAYRNAEVLMSLAFTADPAAVTGPSECPEGIVGAMPALDARLLPGARYSGAPGDWGFLTSARMAELAKFAADSENYPRDGIAALGSEDDAVIVLLADTGREATTWDGALFVVDLRSGGSVCSTTLHATGATHEELVTNLKFQAGMALGEIAQGATIDW
jgi:hypothetical protein